MVCLLKRPILPLPGLISENGVTTVRVVYSDQHGIMRRKALSTENFLLALQNGVADTFSNLGKDSSNTPVFPLFEADGGFGVEQMGGAGDKAAVSGPDDLQNPALGAGHGVDHRRYVFEGSDPHADDSSNPDLVI